MGRVLESRFQADLICEIKSVLKDVIVMKLDSGYKQGIPDLLILYRDKWATLECKRTANAPHRPNQDWYVNRMDGMSFSRFIYPENRAQTLRALFDFLNAKEGQNEIQQSSEP